MWTLALIERLKKYIDGSRYFQVYYQSHRVYGMDLVPPEHAAEFPPEQAEIYLQEYDDAPPDGVVLAETEPTDFHVYLLMPLGNFDGHGWTQQDPDWSAADPEAWKEAHE